jgi:hypothetical protein
MSKKPLTIPLDLIAYKQLSLKGFWISQWHKDHTVAERSAMFEDIISSIRREQLMFFFELHDLDDFQYALSRSQEKFYLRKVVLSLDYPDRMKEHDKKTKEDYEMFETTVV